MSEDIKQGDRVRFLGGPYGLLANPNATKFEDGVVNEGDEGIYDQPHPNLPQWHLIIVGDELYCPVASGMFEKIKA